MTDFESRLAQLSDHPNFKWSDNSSRKGRESGSGGGMDDLTRRVGVLETKMDKVQETLGSIQVTLARIEASMATKDELHALAMHVAVLDERTNKLATTKGVAVMVSVAVAILTAAARWHDLVAHFTSH
ncbi:hypothetical protein [Neokomagataea anthophila]|uniref:DUF1515 domain-containing protein n=1 Tax=Neokomagataea anthophila TaxID=2826925 RepID=A0ABS5E865_9PROT|nr:hypothetical protein [Neokomagataea anthophila]MBR0560074.1 hypothetical protein [Neokomagataea anthophila]